MSYELYCISGPVAANMPKSKSKTVQANANEANPDNTDTRSSPLLTVKGMNTTIRGTKAELNYTDNVAKSTARRGILIKVREAPNATGVNDWGPLEGDGDDDDFAWVDRLRLIFVHL